MRTWTVRAENLRMRQPLALIAVDGVALAEPVFGAAYKREGEIVIALATKQHRYLLARQQVTVTYEPAELPGVKALRWCSGQQDPKRIHERHLRRIGPDPSATAYCDANVAAFKKVKAAHPEVTDWAGQHFAQKREERKQALEAKVGRALDRPQPSQERMIVNLLTGVARVRGVDSAAFAKEAAHWGFSVEQATQMVSQH